jgi:APA family basic amino acid/polyamine antiporter
MNLSTMEFIKAFGIAMIAALWAYDGWNGLPKIAGEVKDPQKNIPRAIGVGLFLVMCLYLLINLSYFHILSLGEIQNDYSQLHPESLPVATLAAQKFLSSWGVPFISLVFVVSALGGMNGSIIMGSRVPYAMAAYGLLPKKLAYVEQNMHTPVWSLIIQGTIALFLALSGTFDQLTEYVVVINWIFYVITASTIFYFRKNKYQSSYKSPLFPVLPIVFILSSFFIIINSLLENPNHFFKGLIFMCLGLPVYYYYSREPAQKN